MDELDSTDVSSPIDPEDLTASSMGEADKQIMEWAGKLELESVDLREKSEMLMKSLKESSAGLSKVTAKLYADLARSDKMRQEILDKITKFESAIEKQAQGLKAELKNGSHSKVDVGLKEIKCKIDKIQDSSNTARSIEYLHEIVYNMSLEVESIAKSVRQLYEKPDDDVSRLERYIERTITRTIQQTMEKDVASGLETMITKIINTKFQENMSRVLDQRSMLQNKVDVHQELEGTTWTCSSQDKIHVRQKRVSKKRIVRNRNLETSRTIIPWDEISSPPPANFTSEI